MTEKSGFLKILCQRIWIRHGMGSRPRIGLDRLAVRTGRNRAGSDPAEAQLIAEQFARSSRRVHEGVCQCLSVHERVPCAAIHRCRSGIVRQAAFAAARRLGILLSGKCFPIDATDRGGSAIDFWGVRLDPLPFRIGNELTSTRNCGKEDEA